jgi:hypothetical protein
VLNDPTCDMAIPCRERSARDAFHEQRLQVEGNHVDGGGTSRRSLPDIVCEVENDKKHLGRSGAMALIPCDA